MTDIRITLENLFAESTRLLAQGDARGAMAVAHRAWALAPESADCSNLVGVCAHSLGDGVAAERCWQHAIALDRNTVEARFNLAQYHADAQRNAEAEEYLRQTVTLAPGHAAAFARLGNLLSKRSMEQDTGEAERCYRRALELEPQNAAVRTDLAFLVAQEDRHAEAEALYRQALAQAPDNAQACANFALLLESMQCWEEAEIHHRQALRWKPDSSEILSNLGNLLFRTARHGEAETAYLQAIALAPTSAVAHSNLAVLLADLQRDEAAEKHLRRALELRPDYQLARLNLALLLLTNGRLEEGWALHEARHHPDLPGPDTPRPGLSVPQWQGEPLTGKSLLIWPEQGLGDMIQFCRYIPLLKQQGARRIDLVCRDAQVALLRSLDGVDEVVALDDAAAISGKHDFWTFPMSLPWHAHTTLDNIPGKLPYLDAPLERRATWVPRIALSGETGTRKRVGLMWRGNPLHANDKHRSLPGFTVLNALLDVDTAQFFNLQIDNREALPENIVDFGSDITDFVDSAALLQQLDLLITVDTAMAHLAGALGVPCWVLLPAYRTDWRWMRNRTDSPWYPGVMRLYRQAAGEDWAAVAMRVAADLRALAR